MKINPDTKAWFLFWLIVVGSLSFVIWKQYKAYWGIREGEIWQLAPSQPIEFNPVHKLAYARDQLPFGARCEIKKLLSGLEGGDMIIAYRDSSGNLVVKKVLIETFKEAAEWRKQ